MLKLGTPIEISTKRQQNQATVALVWSMLSSLIPVKKSTALLQTTITFVPSLRLGCFFLVLIAENPANLLSGRLSRRERVEHPVARCCARGVVSTATVVGFLLVSACCNITVPKKE